MSAVWRHGPVERSQRLLLLAIADNANDDAVAWPSTQTLAGKACMTVRTVSRTLEALVMAGWLEVLPRSFERRGNTYKLNVAKLKLSEDKMSSDEPSPDNLSRDSTGHSQQSDRTFQTPRQDILNNPPAPPIGRTVKKHQEPSPAVRVRRLFAYYLRRTEQNPKEYELTPARLNIGLARLKDCERMSGGDLDQAELKMGTAIDAMLASDFHKGKNDDGLPYRDWIENLFKTTEKLQWWLAKKAKNGHVLMTATESKR
jgi:DNA-binding MarR family transcriptional regulator